jgi:hypothetical protein
LPVSDPNTALSANLSLLAIVRVTSGF